MNRRIVLAGLLIVAVLVSVILLTMHHGSSSQPQQDSSGVWTAQQKVTAQKVLTSAPVNESPALAACVVSKVSTLNTYSQFQQYAMLAAVDNFNSPNVDQQSVISNLMISALSCPGDN